MDYAVGVGLSGRKLEINRMAAAHAKILISQLKPDNCGSHGNLKSEPLCEALANSRRGMSSGEITVVSEQI